jgi:hypothetical protein
MIGKAHKMLKCTLRCKISLRKHRDVFFILRAEMQICAVQDTSPSTCHCTLQELYSPAVPLVCYLLIDYLTSGALYVTAYKQELYSPAVPFVLLPTHKPSYLWLCIQNSKQTGNLQSCSFTCLLPVHNTSYLWLSIQNSKQTGTLQSCSFTCLLPIHNTSYLWRSIQNSK